MLIYLLYIIRYLSKINISLQIYLRESLVNLLKRMILSVLLSFAHVRKFFAQAHPLSIGVFDVTVRYFVFVRLQTVGNIKLMNLPCNKTTCFKKYIIFCIIIDNHRHYCTKSSYTCTV